MSKTIDDKKKASIEELSTSIQYETEIFFKNNSDFLVKGNKQAAKRARVSSLKISKLTKQYRTLSNELVSEKA
jgi:iron-sulfur cluster repair protein YtfE (RIC family)